MDDLENKQEEKDDYTEDDDTYGWYIFKSVHYKCPVCGTPGYQGFCIVCDFPNYSQ